MQSGRYANASEVLCEGLRLSEVSFEAAKLYAIQQVARQGEADGVPGNRAEGSDQAPGESLRRPRPRASRRTP